MAWTTPRTWNTGDLLTSTDMNLYVRDNLLALKNPASGFARFKPASLYISSTTFTDLDSSLNFSLTTAGGPLLIALSGRVLHSPGAMTDCFFDVNIGGSSQGGADGIIWVYATNTYGAIFSTTWLTSALTAGTHTVKIQCRRGIGNANPVQILDIVAMVREVS